MRKYATYYCCLPSGRAPVRDFVDTLDIATYRKFVFKKELLEEFGAKLPLPHAKYMGNDLYELRFKGTDGAIRVFYFFMEARSIIFLHAFVKKSSKTPEKELSVALKRIKNYLK